MKTIRRLLRRRDRLPEDVSDELQAEIDAPTEWMYPWRLTDEVTVPVMHPLLPAVHATREALIEPVAHDALRHGGRAVDLGAHEGWFAHRALEWGAKQVLAVDVREINTRRAVLLRDHYGIDPDRLEVRTQSVYDVDADQVGRFDVVLILGLIYHLENPIGALRIAAKLAARGAPVIVDSQLTRQVAPVQHSDGGAGQVHSEAASWAARLEPSEEQEGTPLASYGGVISLIPNRAALVQAMEVAGLRDVKVLESPADSHPEYARGDRVVAVGQA